MTVREHYDRLIAMGNDPFLDGPELRAYMDKWDGEPFIDALGLTGAESVLEIGVGTGRLAARCAPRCKRFVGVDLSPKTVERARVNLSAHKNVELICADFFAYTFSERFDVIYSSLTFMHFSDKGTAVKKAAECLKPSGRFCLSVSRDGSRFIDMGDYRVRVYPDRSDVLVPAFRSAGLELKSRFETEFAEVFVCEKPARSGPPREAAPTARFESTACGPMWSSAPTGSPHENRSNAKSYHTTIDRQRGPV